MYHRHNKTNNGSTPYEQEQHQQQSPQLLTAQQQQQQYPPFATTAATSYNTAAVAPVPYQYVGYYAASPTTTTETMTSDNYSSEQQHELHENKDWSTTPTLQHRRGTTPTTTSTGPLIYNSITKNNNSTLYYNHNGIIALFWIPCFCSIYATTTTNYNPLSRNDHATTTSSVLLLPVNLFIINAIALYAIDLANVSRTMNIYFVLICTAIHILFFIYIQFYQVLDVIRDGASSTIMLAMTMQTIFVCCLYSIFYCISAIWFIIQNRWLIVELHQHQQQEQNLNRDTSNRRANTDANSRHTNDTTATTTFQFMESIVHGLLPPIFAGCITYSITNYFAAITIRFMPYLFLISMLVAMILIGACTTSSSTTPTRPTSFTTNDDLKNDLRSLQYCISNRIAYGHIILVCIVPGMVQIVNDLYPLLYSGDLNLMYDTILALTLPYVLVKLILLPLHTNKVLPTPYGNVLLASSSLRPKMNTIYSIFSGCVISWCIQHRYLIVICQKISYHYFGTQMSYVLCSLYWTINTVILVVLFLIFNSTLDVNYESIQQEETSTVTVAVAPNALFGEYQEDIIQLLICAFGLFLGKAFGLPWSMTPLPILGILGITFWLQTRMLRYLLIVLFVVNSVGVIAFSYRYIGMEQIMLLPLPNLNIPLVRFGFLITVSSVTIGLISGLAVRSSGGYMASLLKKLDVVGLLTISYTVLLMILEISLLKRPVPAKELSGIELDDEDIDETLYDVPRVVFTSCIVIVIVLFMKRARMIHEWSSAVAVSLSMGKVIAIYTYATQHSLGTGSHQHYLHSHDPRGTNIMYRSFIAAVLCAIMFIPRVFLKPVRLKNVPRNRRSFNGVAGATIPPDAIRLIVLYTMGFVPISLLATLPYVVFPLINALRAQVTQASYYASSTPPISELIGSAMAVWGLAVISMLHHYLPDGGGEAWKKLSALAFLMGLGIYFVAPTMGLGLGSVLYNPYAHVSSVGEQIIIRGKSQTSGWGLISAALATLLATSGPLELKERIYSSGRKDKYLLLRTLIFCFMFGGGVSWFIVLQTMSDSEWIMVVLVVLATLVLAFLGTVATVLGYYLEPDNFDEIEQIATTWCYGLLAFFPITGVPLVLYSGSPRWFGPGGWLAPYLGIGSLSSFTFALSLRCRQSKTARTKGLGNMACVISWLLSNLILYGRYGVGGLDGNMTLSTIAGIPFSVLGTIVVSLILFTLDGETSSSRGRGARGTITTSHRNFDSLWRLNLPRLVQNNLWFPPFAGTIIILILSSLYAILLRGANLLSIFVPNTKPVNENILKALQTSLRGQGDHISVLVQQAMTTTMKISTQVASSSFWTSQNLLNPVLHLVGVISLLPSLVLLHRQYWLDKPVPSAEITVVAPFTAIPLLFCRSLPTLTVASFLTCSCACTQLFLRKRSEHASRIST